MKTSNLQDIHTVNKTLLHHGLSALGMSQGKFHSHMLLTIKFVFYINSKLIGGDSFTTCTQGIQTYSGMN